MCRITLWLQIASMSALGGHSVFFIGWYLHGATRGMR